VVALGRGAAGAARSYRGAVTHPEDPSDEVYRITGAAPSRSKDLDRRINRYLISMAIRTACVILVFVVPGPARWVFAAGAVFLPYVAVLLANASSVRPEAGPAPVERRGVAAAPDLPEPAPTTGPEVLQGHVISSTTSPHRDDG
jgi:Protein of unknown function (DUF3099)